MKRWGLELYDVRLRPHKTRGQKRGSEEGVKFIVEECHFELFLGFKTLSLGKDVSVDAVATLW